MANYQKMYTTLFNAATDAIENIRSNNFDRAEMILIQAQQKTEDLFINSRERSVSAENDRMIEDSSF